MSININSRNPKPAGFDSSARFKTNIPDVIGFVATYKLVSAGFAFVLKPGTNTDKNYAASRY
jgi:hypothetical protein